MLILVTGGVASGKSEIAESMAISLNKGELAYIATMKTQDEECRQRVAKHRMMRDGKGFTTFEVPYDLSLCSDQFSCYDTALLECLSNLIANEMYLAGKSGTETVEEISAAVQKLTKQIRNLVIVAGTIFTGVKPYDQFTEEYIRILGKLNSKIGAEADAVIEAVCSIPVMHKGKNALRGVRI